MNFQHSFATFADAIDPPQDLMDEVQSVGWDWLVKHIGNLVSPSLPPKAVNYLTDVDAIKNLRNPDLSRPHLLMLNVSHQCLLGPLLIPLQLLSKDSIWKGSPSKFPCPFISAITSLRYNSRGTPKGQQAWYTHHILYGHKNAVQVTVADLSYLWIYSSPIVMKEAPKSFLLIISQR